MTEPEEPELAEWFWWASCTLFSELGRYANEMSTLGLKDDGQTLAPLRFVQNGEPNQETLVRHFKQCGIRIQDANEHLLDFSKIYITNIKPPTVPDWSQIPPSNPRVSRPSINQWRKCGNKAFVDRNLPVPGRIYIDRTPSGSAPEFPSEPQTGNSSRPPTNEDRNYVLDGYFVRLNGAKRIWEDTGGNPVKESEFWIPQKETRPPNESYYYFADLYLEQLHIRFDHLTERWIASETQEFVPNEYFNTPVWIQGTVDALPENLRPRHLLSTPTTTKGKKKASFSLNNIGTTPTPAQQPTNPKPGPSNPTEQKDEEDPFNPDRIEVDEPKPNPTPPHRDPSPSPSPTRMSGGTTDPTPNPQIPSLIGDLPEFKGKRKDANTFIEDIEIFFDMNPERMNTDCLKILAALNKISDGARQWKKNKLADLRKSRVTTEGGVTRPALFNDWDAFKLSFLTDWGEVDPSGNTYTKILNLQNRLSMKGKKQMTLPNYVNQFKEQITKARIKGEAAFHMFGKGLTAPEFEKAMLMNPKTLQDWYDIAIKLDNIRTRSYAYSPRSGNGHSSSSHNNESWAMQIDHKYLERDEDPELELVIRSMSKEEREHYIRDGLCFICGIKGHMSGQCPKKKRNKGKG
ncbi:hypothetical protein F5887DRAFT_1080351 [Amanita rubescens]|nr:hypothetical protein F5887DRAFT_1080351 [Amanita rubescens]